MSHQVIAARFTSSLRSVFFGTNNMFYIFIGETTKFANSPSRILWGCWITLNYFICSDKSILLESPNQNVF